MHLSRVEVETMHPIRTRQLELSLENDRLWERLPESTRNRIQELLSRLLLEVIQCEVKQRRSGDE